MKKMITILCYLCVILFVGCIIYKVYNSRGFSFNINDLIVVDGTSNDEFVIDKVPIEINDNNSDIEIVKTSPISVNKTTTTQSTTNTTTRKTQTTTKKIEINNDTSDNKVVIETKEEEIQTPIEEKYGTIIFEIENKKYDVYSDGTTGNERITKKKKYDYEGYKAEYADMKDEALKLVMDNQDIIKSIVDTTNLYREEENQKVSINIPKLELDHQLCVMATVRAMEMAYSGELTRLGTVVHERPNGKKWSTIYQDAGYVFQAAGENIAAGQKNAESVCQSWKNSSNHYANMIGINFGRIGIGYIKFNNVTYWVQLFSN